MSAYFPIIDGPPERYRKVRVQGVEQTHLVPALKSLPWDMLAPHESQAERNHGQTLEQLARRGGLSINEALWVLEERELTADPFPPAAEAERRLREHLKAWSRNRLAAVPKHKPLWVEI